MDRAPEAGARSTRTECFLDLLPEIGLTVLEHRTHGKHLLTRLSNDLTLHTHLLMSGSWTVPDTGRWLPKAVTLGVRVVLRTDGPAAYGVKIPIVELLRTRDEGDVIGHLGPDPLRGDWDIAEAARRLSENPDRPLVAALLDQRCVAGFGNLWAQPFTWSPRSQAIRSGGAPGGVRTVSPVRPARPARRREVGDCRKGLSRADGGTPGLVSIPNLDRVLTWRR